MTPWRTLSDADVHAVTARTFRRYRRPLGTARARQIADRRAARLRTPHRPSDVEIECEALFEVLRHLADGRTTEDAWALGEIYAADMRTARAVAFR